MKRSTLSTALYLFLVFAGGAAVGGFAHRLYTMDTVLAKPEEYRSKVVDELHTRLSLTDQQIVQLNTIFDATKTRVKEVKDRWAEQAKQASKPELKAINEDQAQKIKAMLTDTQRVEYEKFRAERAKARLQHQQQAKPQSN
jgi:putative sterol carrier protein